MATTPGKTWLKRITVLAIVLAVVFGAVKALQVRKAKQAMAEQAAAALRTPTVFELGANDVVQVHSRTLETRVDVSGTVRALNTAVVKAKVAGEVQGLTVREGDRVSAGQVLGRIDPTEFQARVSQADEQAQAAAAQVAIAQRAFTNNQALVNQGFISATALDTSASNLAGAQATHKAALAAVEVARKALSDTALRAPIAGQVAARPVQNGERVGVDARVLEVVDLTSMELEVAVPPAHAAQLRPGQSALIDVEGLPQPVQATIVRISPVAQAASRSVLVYLALQTEPGLHQGLFAKGSVLTGTFTGVSVPVSAVRHDKPQAYVQWLQPVATDTGSGATAHIVHHPIQVLGRGFKRGTLTAEDEEFFIVNTIADGQYIMSGKAGLIPEKTAMKFSPSGAAKP